MAQKNNKPFWRVISYLPDGVRAAVLSYLETGVPEDRVSEIRLRAHGPTSLVVSGDNVSVGALADSGTLADVFRRICDGAVYAHRDDVCGGFVSLGDGIRVGVCGHARYEGGKMVGVGDISALVFRIPTGSCSFAGELYRRWMSERGGMLICSRAGEGKTTAIRALAGLIGSGRAPLRVVVVDERCEFEPSSYRSSQVDILSGYRRSTGIDIAIRTMSAEVLIVDEISTKEDAEALSLAIGAGVEVIATAHGDTPSKVLGRECIASLAAAGLFRSICTVKREKRSFSFSLERLTDIYKTRTDFLK